MADIADALDLAAASLLSSVSLQTLSGEHSCPDVSFGLKKNYQTSDYNPALIPYFDYLKMEISKFFNTGFFSNCDFKEK